MAKIIKSNLKKSDRINLVYNNKDVEMSLENFKIFMHSLEIEDEHLDNASEALYGYFDIKTAYGSGGESTETINPRFSKYLIVSVK